MRVRGLGLWSRPVRGEKLPVGNPCLRSCDFLCVSTALRTEAELRRPLAREIGSCDLMKDSFLEELSEPRPNPGGGSAAAHGALLALCITEKVARLELARQSQGTGAPSTSSLTVIEDLKARLVSLREEDTQAYLRLATVRASGAKDSRFAEALAQAINCPMTIVRVGLQVLACVSEIGVSCKKHLLADLQVALEFAIAAMRGALHIARANMKLMPDSALLKKRLSRLEALREESERAFQHSSDLLNSYAVEK